MGGDKECRGEMEPDLGDWVQELVEDLATVQDTRIQDSWCHSRGEADGSGGGAEDSGVEDEGSGDSSTGCRSTGTDTQCTTIHLGSGDLTPTFLFFFLLYAVRRKIIWKQDIN